MRTPRDIALIGFTIAAAAFGIALIAYALAGELTVGRGVMLGLITVVLAVAAVLRARTGQRTGS